MRKISFGEGVERVFPVMSPMIESIEVKRRGAVRRASMNSCTNSVPTSRLRSASSGRALLSIGAPGQKKRSAKPSVQYSASPMLAVNSAHSR